MTNEQLAFIEACSGIAPDEVTEIFLTKLDDHDAFFEEYQEYYSGLADAYQVWCMARSFFTTQRKLVGIAPEEYPDVRYQRETYYAGIEWAQQKLMEKNT